MKKKKNTAKDKEAFQHASKKSLNFFRSQNAKDVILKLEKNTKRKS